MYLWSYKMVWDTNQMVHIDSLKEVKVEAMRQFIKFFSLSISELASYYRGYICDFFEKKL